MFWTWPHKAAHHALLLHAMPYWMIALEPEFLPILYVPEMSRVADPELHLPPLLEVCRRQMTSREETQAEGKEEGCKAV